MSKFDQDEIDNIVMEALVDLKKLLPDIELTPEAFNNPTFLTVHFLIVEVVRQTGFAAGLYSEDELEMPSLSDTSSSRHADFVARMQTCVSVCEGVAVGGRNLLSEMASGTSPLASASFFSALCRVASDATIDRGAVVAMALAHQAPISESPSLPSSSPPSLRAGAGAGTGQTRFSPESVPRLNGRAVLVVEVVSAAGLRSPNGLGWGGALSSCVEVWTSGAGRNKRMATPVARSAGPDPCFGSSNGSSSGRAAVPFNRLSSASSGTQQTRVKEGIPNKFQFVIEKPQKEHFIVSVLAVKAGSGGGGSGGGGGGGGGRVSIGGGGLRSSKVLDTALSTKVIGEADVSLLLVPRQPTATLATATTTTTTTTAAVADTEVEVPLLADSGEQCGALVLRMIMYPMCAPATAAPEGNTVVATTHQQKAPPAPLPVFPKPPTGLPPPSKSFGPIPASALLSKQRRLSHANTDRAAAAATVRSRANTTSAFSSPSIGDGGGGGGSGGIRSRFGLSIGGGSNAFKHASLAQSLSSRKSVGGSKSSKREGEWKARAPSECVRMSAAVAVTTAAVVNDDPQQREGGDAEIGGGGRQEVGSKKWSKAFQSEDTVDSFLGDEDDDNDGWGGLFAGLGEGDGDGSGDNDGGGGGDNGQRSENRLRSSLAASNPLLAGSETKVAVDDGGDGSGSGDGSTVEKPPVLTAEFEEDDMFIESEFRLTESLLSPNPLLRGCGGGDSLVLVPALGRQRAATTGGVPSKVRFLDDNDNSKSKDNSSRPIPSQPSQPPQPSQLAPAQIRGQEALLYDMGFSTKVASQAMAKFASAAEAIEFCVQASEREREGGGGGDDDEEDEDEEKPAAALQAGETKARLHVGTGSAEKKNAAGGSEDDNDAGGGEDGGEGFWELDPATAKRQQLSRQQKRGFLSSIFSSSSALPSNTTNNSSSNSSGGSSGRTSGFSRSRAHTAAAATTARPGGSLYQTAAVFRSKSRGLLSNRAFGGGEANNNNTGGGDELQLRKAFEEDGCNQGLATRGRSKSGAMARADLVSAVSSDSNGSMRVLAQSYFGALLSATFAKGQGKLSKQEDQGQLQENRPLGFQVANRARDCCLEVTRVSGLALECGVKEGDVVVGLNGRQFPYGSVGHEELLRILSTLPRPLALHFWRTSTQAAHGLAASTADHESATNSAGTHLNGFSPAPPPPPLLSWSDVHIPFNQGALGIEVEAKVLSEALALPTLPPSLSSSSPTNSLSRVVVAVSSLKRGGQALTLGVQVGDLVVGVNGTPLVDGTSLHGFASKLKKLSAPPVVVLWRCQRKQQPPDDGKKEEKEETKEVVGNEEASGGQKPKLKKGDGDNSDDDAKFEEVLRKTLAASMVADKEAAMEGSPAADNDADSSSIGNGGCSSSSGGSSSGSSGGSKPRQEDGARLSVVEYSGAAVVAEKLAQLRSMGFPVTAAKLALRAANGDLDAAVEALLTGGIAVAPHLDNPRSSIAAVPPSLSAPHSSSPLNKGGGKDGEEEEKGGSGGSGGGGGSPSQVSAPPPCRRIGCMQHIAAGKMLSLVPPPTTPSSHNAAVSSSSTTRRSSISSGGGGGGAVVGSSNWASAEVAVVYTEARVGLEFERAADGRLAVAKASFVSASRGVKAGDILVGMGNAPLGFGLEQGLVSALIDSTPRPLVLNFWRPNAEALAQGNKQEVGVFFGSSVQSLGLDLELGADGRWAVAEVEEGGMAQLRGLVQGDVVVGANHWPLPPHCDLFEVLGHAGRPLTLNVVVSRDCTVAIRGDKLVNQPSTPLSLASSSPPSSGGVAPVDDFGAAPERNVAASSGGGDKDGDEDNDNGDDDDDAEFKEVLRKTLEASMEGSDCSSGGGGKVEAEAAVAEAPVIERETSAEATGFERDEGIADRGHGCCGGGGGVSETPVEDTQSNNLVFATSNIASSAPTVPTDASTRPARKKRAVVML